MNNKITLREIRVNSAQAFLDRFELFDPEHETIDSALNLLYWAVFCLQSYQEELNLADNRIDMLMQSNERLSAKNVELNNAKK